VRARVDAHRDDADRQRALPHRLVLGQRRDEALGRRHVVGGRRQRHEHHVAPLIASRSASPCSRPRCRRRTTAVGAFASLRLPPNSAIGGNSAGPPLEPAARRLLRIAIVDRDALALAGEPAGDVGGERRLAAAALRIRDQDRLHDRPLPGPPPGRGRAAMVAGEAAKGDPPVAHGLLAILDRRRPPWPSTPPP
jgi:hypothetical protein